MACVSNMANVLAEQLRRQDGCRDAWKLFGFFAVIADPDGIEGQPQLLGDGGHDHRGSAFAVDYFADNRERYFAFRGNVLELDLLHHQEASDDMGGHSAAVEFWF